MAAVATLFAERKVTHVLLRKDLLAHEVGDANVDDYRRWLTGHAVVYEDQRYLLCGPLVTGD